MKVLNEVQMLDLLRLQDCCESFEDIELKLNWETLKTRNEEDGLDFYHYEEDQLVGFLGVYHFGEEYEVCGMVHPDYRGRGIFSMLFNEALKTIPEGYPLLINAPHTSQSAQKWIETCKCDYSFSEYQMKWIPQILSPEPSKVMLRKATVVDAEFLMHVDAECFGFQHPDMDTFSQSTFESADSYTYIIEENQESIGKIQVIRMNDYSYIYGFAILPEYQGQGFGRSALLQTIQVETEIGNEIFIEVALQNRNALHLYEQCGFVSYQIQDYYEYR